MKVAIVTGGSSGIGAATARQLAKRGWRVAINYAHKQKMAERAATECGNALAVRADVAQDADCRRLARTVLDKFGAIDALVNNAGTTKLVPHGAERAAETEKRYSSIAPLKAISEAEDVADAIVWLIEGARGVTGDVVYVDGGMHIASPR